MLSPHLDGRARLTAPRQHHPTAPDDLRSGYLKPVPLQPLVHHYAVSNGLPDIDVTSGAANKKKVFQSPFLFQQSQLYSHYCGLVIVSLLPFKTACLLDQWLGLLTPSTGGWDKVALYIVQALRRSAGVTKANQVGQHNNGHHSSVSPFPSFSSFLLPSIGILSIRAKGPRGLLTTKTSPEYQTGIVIIVRTSIRHSLILSPPCRPSLDMIGTSPLLGDGMKRGEL